MKSGGIEMELHCRGWRPSRPVYTNQVHLQFLEGTHTHTYTHNCPVAYTLQCSRSFPSRCLGTADQGLLGNPQGGGVSLPNTQNTHTHIHTQLPRRLHTTVFLEEIPEVSASATTVSEDKRICPPLATSASLAA